MLHSLAARALLMMTDCRITLTDAIEWVTRRLPINLIKYYRTAVMRLVVEEL